MAQILCNVFRGCELEDLGPTVEDVGLVLTIHVKLFRCIIEQGDAVFDERLTLTSPDGLIDDSGA